MTRRLALVLTIATLSGLYSYAVQAAQPNSTVDLGLVIAGAQSYAAGLDPYATVGHVAPWLQVPALIYPFPAVLLLLPFVSVPPILLASCWVAIGAGLLAWAVTREQLVTPALALFISTPFLHAVTTAQWSPMLTAAALLPWGGWMLACKPSTALWLFAYRPSWRSFGLAAGFGLLSLALWPTWPWEWVANLPAAVNSMSPLTLPGGFLALAALWRWRLPEARMLAVMAIVPHATLPYELVPLFLIPRTWPEAGVLSVGAMVATAIWKAGLPYDSSTALTAAFGSAAIWCVYLPCVGMILLRRSEQPQTYRQDTAELTGV